MAFDQSTITAGPDLATDDAELRVSWASSAPPGTHFQIYVDGLLSWVGTATVAFLPLPYGPADVVVGTVAAGEDATDFSASLPAPSGTGMRPDLSWIGGRFLDEGLEGFRIYRSPTAGSAISYAAPIDVVAAAEQGLWHDGYGRGGYGSGGYGRAAQVYRWEGDPLGPGDWSFAVVPFDAEGNASAGPHATITVSVVAAPEPPAIGVDRKRARLAYDPTTRVATLSWLASPT